MNPIEAAQQFLGDRIQQLTKPGTIEQLGYMKAHPVLGAVNGISKATGGPGLTEGFKDGVIDDRAYGRGGSYNVNLPPMPF